MSAGDRTPRVGPQEYSCTAIVYFGNRQLTCRVNRICSGWVELFATDDLPRGAFVRLNITLPGVSEVFDLDGVVARHGEVQGHLTLEISFHEPTDTVIALVDAFTEWLQERRAAGAQPGSESGDWSADPPSFPRPTAEYQIIRETTGPHFPRITTSQINRAISDDDLRREYYRQQKARLRDEQVVKERRQVRERQARQELRRRYRRDLERLYPPPPGAKDDDD